MNRGARGRKNAQVDHSGDDLFCKDQSSIIPISRNEDPAHFFGFGEKRFVSGMRQP